MTSVAAIAYERGIVIRWGAWFDDSTPWNWTAVSEFERAVGKSVSLVQFGTPFENCQQPKCYFYAFPRDVMESIRRHGAVPLLSWSSASIPTAVDQPDFQLADLIDGRYDKFIRQFADDAHRWGHPFLLRFDWEMNGVWFPWAEQANGNRPGQFGKLARVRE